VLFDAFLASQRCNLVERRRSLPPLRPPGGWQTVGNELRAGAAAAVGQVGRSLTAASASDSAARSRLSVSLRDWLAQSRRPRLRATS
jgi:hypothetical protein